MSCIDQVFGRNRRRIILFWLVTKFLGFGKISNPFFKFAEHIISPSKIRRSKGKSGLQFEGLISFFSIGVTTRSDPRGLR